MPENLTPQSNLRNIAIIAHVDHGKTTLVDAMLKQSHIFRENEHVGELIMDSNALEKERGITILAKNTSITYRGIKINIIDTPGHADFSGEVERVLNMADGCLLLVDAFDGPMPQTRFVLKKALAKGLKPIVVINKIDRPMARPEEVLKLIQDLFLDLVTDADQLDFPVIYAIGKQGIAINNLSDPHQSMEPLFEAIVKHIPAPSADVNAPFQFLVAALEYDNHLGQIVVGRVVRGKAVQGMRVVRIEASGETTPYTIERMYVFQGLDRKEILEAPAGEIISFAGVKKAYIGETVAATETPEVLPGIPIEEPTVKMSFGVNTSPFAGKDAKWGTSRQLRERLNRELLTNVSLRVEETDSADTFMVAGRGELHLSILIETMRREGFEFEVSKPEAITKMISGKWMEPYEQLIVDTIEDFIGAVSENLSSRLAQMTNMYNDGSGNVRMEYKIPTRGLVGFRTYFLQVTRGRGVMNSLFLDYEPIKGEVRQTRGGALVAHEPGIAVAFGINAVQLRGSTFVEPGTPVYEGMIVGLHAREKDLVVNICKEKKLTNMRSSTSDVGVRLTPAVKFSLEECLDFIERDELLEVTPKNLRMRKKILSFDDRYRHGKSSGSKESKEEVLNEA
ncbi:MAG: translational GTPase TypA [Dehalococcoidia bacterium]|nr:translational GTPase TypA [Dehalococcoidia bacterium]